MKLAGPTTVVMVAQTFVAIAETFIFGRLGTEALAGFALVFPLMMMMTMMAAGGMGGGVAAAMARTLGAGRRDDARALVLHALILGAVLALVFTLLAWTVAPALYRLLGGEGRALDHAVTYSNVLFSGAIAIWANFFLSALLRGGGDAATPGRYMLLSSIAQVPLSYVLALGIGDWPGLGMAGPAISSLLTSAVSALLQARALWGGKLGFVPGLGGLALQGRLFWDILKVGLIASFSAFTANLTAMLVTGLVGRFGIAALAGYGIGVRLEFMLVPLAFGIGSGLTTIVGVAAGANDWRRAVRAAWIGSLVAGLGIGAFGWIVALVPEGWAQLFTSDPEVIAATVAYITRVAPFYCLFGVGMTLSFASQGANRMVAPFLAGVTRLFVATLGGWFAIEILGWGLEGVFTAIAVGMVVFGALIAGPLLVHPWRGRA
ncbi:MATE family efflux transporter [Reyranella sp.]|uniref:MATE family efflux transporter n=1 Tax=Reyranella sp. TaxID=1929291 RepID=UPI00272FC0BD|nr:MATE family efflux transporter [Reyranella sp.]MDP2372455.1 MATE family efflux transporter [Reyranella sp.]